MVKSCKPSVYGTFLYVLIRQKNCQNIHKNNKENDQHFLTIVKWLLWVNNQITQADILLSKGRRIFQWIDIHRRMRIFYWSKEWCSQRL